MVPCDVAQSARSRARSPMPAGPRRGVYARPPSLRLVPEGRHRVRAIHEVRQLGMQHGSARCARANQATGATRHRVLAALRVSRATPSATRARTKPHAPESMSSLMSMFLAGGIRGRVRGRLAARPAAALAPALRSCVAAAPWVVGVRLEWVLAAGARASARHDVTCRAGRARSCSRPWERFPRG